MKFENPHNIFDSDTSLIRHHKAKEKYRNQQLDLIPVKANSNILDIGIGPGLYLAYWLDRTKFHNAKFDLFDSSSEALAKCSVIAAANNSSDRVRTIEGDLFLDIAHLRKATYDVVFIGNTLEYVPDPTSYIATFILPLLKQGGLLAIRDLDCSYMSCSTVDSELNAKIVRSRIENNAANSRKNIENYQNPFIGRDLESIMRKAGVEIVAVHPFLIQFDGPIRSPQLEYLEALHTNWYIEDSQGILTKAEKELWSNLFNSTKTGNVFDRSDTRYIEAEFLVIGQKG